MLLSVHIYNQIISWQWKTCEINNKILNHVQTQNKMMEVVKNTRNRGMHLLLANVPYLSGYKTGVLSL